MTFTLSRADSLAYIGDREWKKGQSYVRGLTGLSAQPDLGHTVLRASAHGQEKYAVTVTLNAGEVAEALCSCPVGGGGGCKHVAALLARAVDDPASFAVLPALDEVLDGMDTAQLRLLVRRMLKREPELLALLLTVPRAAGGHDLQRRIEAAFALIDYDPEEDWGGEGPDLSDLEPLLEEVQAQLSGLDVLDEQARTHLLDALLTFLNGCAEIDNEDYDWGITEYVSTARTGLLRLLALELPEHEHENALDGLQESIGDFGWDEGEMEAEGQFELLAALPEDTQHMLRAFVHGLMDATPETYRRRALAGTLLALSSETDLDPEEELRLARATGNQAEVVRVLFRHGRIEEAITALSKGGRPLAPQEVETEFQERDLMPRLEDYARSHLRVFGARAWLYGRYCETGRTAEAHALAREAVLTGTDEHEYYTSRFLTRDLNWLKELHVISPDWPADREAYIARQWTFPARSGDLMRFVLDEGLLDWAERIVNRSPAGRPLLVSAALVGELALQLPADRARPLILRAVAEHVASQGRDHYSAAARLLCGAETLIGQDEVAAIVRTLVQEYPRRTSLKAELKSAGLL
ncbi:SWIM zinc finger family protein [Deinococcus sp.]|uniref:SWIM zinc finger family protein n=1 Tax=Deinococcus sp. TaxID=47478 RepID=UPI0028698865|nr:SWIM zinc finger family protein [Deinococcus sp.]